MVCGSLPGGRSNHEKHVSFTGGKTQTKHVTDDFLQRRRADEMPSMPESDKMWWLVGKEDAYCVSSPNEFRQCLKEHGAIGVFDRQRKATWLSFETGVRLVDAEFERPPKRPFCRYE